jgi:hypothetical protein
MATNDDDNESWEELGETLVKDALDSVEVDEENRLVRVDIDGFEYEFRDFEELRDVLVRAVEEIDSRSSTDDDWPHDVVHDVTVVTQEKPAVLTPCVNLERVVVVIQERQLCRNSARRASSSCPRPKFPRAGSSQLQVTQARSRSCIFRWQPRPKAPRAAIDRYSGV